MTDIMNEKDNVVSEKDNEENTLVHVHPGEILLKDFLLPLGITPYRLAQETNIEQTRISQIIKGKRGISIDTALRFSCFFGNSPEFWINLQSHFDLAVKRHALAEELKQIKKYTDLEKRKSTKK